jgi:hypothetical protein
VPSRNALAPSVDDAVRNAFGMKPNMDRLNLLPRYNERDGLVAPNALYQLARALVAPGVAAQGGAVSEADAINFGGTIMGGSVGAGALGQPGGMIAGMGARAKVGGEVASPNGYFYKGGQFLPSTSEPPGKFRVGGKLVKARKFETEPGKYETQPTATSRSLYQAASPGAYSRRNRETGALEFAPGVRDPNGTLVTPDTVMTQNGLTLQEVIDAYNSGQRWLDIGPG